MVALARITGSGQVTIPAELRRKHHMSAGDHVLWSEDEHGRLIVRPMVRTVEELRGIFPLLPGVATEGDFDDLIDEAFEQGYAMKAAEAHRKNNPE